MPGPPSGGLFLYTQTLPAHTKRKNVATGAGGKVWEQWRAWWWSSGSSALSACCCVPKLRFGWSFKCTGCIPKEPWKCSAFFTCCAFAFAGRRRPAALRHPVRPRRGSGGRIRFPACPFRTDGPYGASAAPFCAAYPSKNGRWPPRSAPVRPM